MQDVIAALQKRFASKRTRQPASESTLSIGRIRGGENINVVPDQCTIEIDRRILPEEDFDAAFRGAQEDCVEAGAPRSSC